MIPEPTEPTAFETASRMATSLRAAAAVPTSAAPTHALSGDRAEFCPTPSWFPKWILRHEVLFVTLVCSLAAIILATYCTWLWSKGDAHSEGDQLHYQYLAKGILQERAYLDTIRPPLYPLLLSASYAFLGENEFAGLSLQWVLGIANCLVLYLVARKLFGRPVAAVALSAAAVYFYYFKQCGFYMTEPLHSVFLGLAVLVGLRALEVGRIGWFVIFGTVLGISALARPTSMMLLPLAAAWPALVRRNWGGPRLALCAVAVAAGFCLAVAPWAARNYSHFGAIVPVSCNSGICLLEGNNPVVLRSRCVKATINCGDTGLLTEAQIASARNEFELDKTCREAAVAYLRSNPSDALQLVLWKSLRFWHLLPLPTDAEPRPMAAWLQYCAVLLLAVLGAVWCRGRWRQLLFVYGTILLYFAGALIFHAYDRARSPIEQFLVIFAAVGFCAVLNRLSGRRPTPSKAEA